MGLGTLVVGVLKSLSHHSCPWDLVEYGGKAVSYPCSVPLRQTAVPPLLPRRPCVQRLYGDGSVLCLLARASASRPSFVAFGVVLGLAMGFGQVMRGAHFFSHNLWAGWWVWFSVAVYGLVSARFAKE